MGRVGAGGSANTFPLLLARDEGLKGGAATADASSLLTPGVCSRRGK